MTDHIHRWRIEEANGPLSRGECACGAARMFGNSEEMTQGPQPVSMPGSRWQNKERTLKSCENGTAKGQLPWQCPDCDRVIKVAAKGSHRRWHERQAQAVGA